MITDELIAKALAASGKTRRHLDPTGKQRMRAALEVVAADIRNAALEEAALGFEAWGNIDGRYAADTIRALKTKVTP